MITHWAAKFCILFYMWVVFHNKRVKKIKAICVNFLSSYLVGSFAPKYMYNLPFLQLI